MRRVAVLFVTLFVLTIFSGMLLTNSMTIVQRVARISNVSGSVSLKRPNQQAFVPVTGDRNAEAGSVIRTGPDGRATLRWANGTTLRVSPNTVLTIDKCRFDKRRGTLLSLFTLSAGQVWVRVVEKLSAESKFEIRTPTATAGVRGTMFAVQVAPDGSTDVLVYEGEVKVRAGALSLGVKQGQKIAVRAGGPTSLRELSDKERAEGREVLAQTAGLHPTLVSEHRASPSG